jgi:acetylornithine/succinyldiaminopimelate/putrescine aminotransferase
MVFALKELLAAEPGDAYALHERHLNAQVPRLLRTLGTDADYARAEGAYLWDTSGQRYLDMLSGFGVFGVGRNHPVVRQALHDVLDADLADMVQFDAPLLPGLLARELLSRAPGMERLYWCNSGSEAVEAALKFARGATGRPRVLYASHAYHGLTAGALSVNGNVEFRKGFGPLLPDTAVPFGDLEALRKQLRKGDVAALLVEPIQGKGVHIPPPGFLAEAARLLHDKGALLICDEVQAGLGRTGKMFAYEHELLDQGHEALPDIVTVAKALSGGFVPVGATMVRAGIFEKVYSSLDRVFVHASTFAGNASAMAAGLATLAVMEDEDLVGNAARRGEQLRSALAEMANEYEFISDVRGRGLMVAFEFGRPNSRKLQATWAAMRAVRKGLFAQMVVAPLYHDHRIITQVAGDHMDVIKLLPPLMVGDEELTWFLDSFRQVMDDAHRGRGLTGAFARRMVGNAIKARQKS